MTTRWPTSSVRAWRCSPGPGWSRACPGSAAARVAAAPQPEPGLARAGRVGPNQDQTLHSDARPRPAPGVAVPAAAGTLVDLPEGHARRLLNSCQPNGSGDRLKDGVSRTSTRENGCLRTAGTLFPPPLCPPDPTLPY